MITGMLWFDNDPKVDLKVKVTRAANYYKNKYGELPDLCYVHPGMLSEMRHLNGGIELRSCKHVLPNHLWMGIKNRVESAK